MSGALHVPDKFAVEYVLMGTLTAEDLAKLRSLSTPELASRGWRVDWYENTGDLPSLDDYPAVLLAPHEYYEKLYTVVDLGLFRFDPPDQAAPVRRVSIFLHGSILPSFQVRARSTVTVPAEQMSPLHYVWQHIGQANRYLRGLALEVGLTPSVETWTVSAPPTTERPPYAFPDNGEELLAACFADDPVTVQSASVIEDDFTVLKLVEQGSEQYLILSPARNNDFAVSRIYYLLLAKARMKRLLDALKRTQVESATGIEQAVERYQTVVRVTPREVSQILRLRNKITKDWDAFRGLRSHVDLALNFLGFHVGTPLEQVVERPLIRYTPGVIRAENAEVDLFYVRPLRDMVSHLDSDLNEALGLVSSVLEVFTIDVNLRLQVLNWRLQVFSVAVAVISVVIALLAITR